MVLISLSLALGLIGVGIWLRRSHSGSRAEVRRASDGTPGSSAETPARPTGVGRLDLIDDLVATAIQEHKLPGCVVVIGRRDQVVLRKAFGARSVEPTRVDLTADTIFNLASLTKPIATATSIMILAERNLLGLDDAVSRYLPVFAAHGKESVTLRQLLTHVSGLPADTPLGDFEHGRAEALRRIYALTPLAPPGTRLIYSNLGFLVLEEVVRQVTRESFDTFSTKRFSPLWDGRDHVPIERRTKGSRGADRTTPGDLHPR